jgi:glycosyltransferase involved in cell wall biosynthesis
VSDAARAASAVTTPHVAVDVRLARAAGHRTYIRNILPRLARLTPSWRWSLIGDAESLGREEWAQGDRIAIVNCAAPVYGMREQLELPLRVPANTDIYWAPHYNVPVALRKRMVVTIHDLAHLRLREYTGRPLRHMYARLMFRAAVAKASAIVCVSEFTRSELSAVLGASTTRATVVHQGIDEAWFRADHGVPTVQPPYFVFVGSLKPHKNLRTLIAAFRRLDARAPERLVIVGKRDGLRTPDQAVLGEIATLGDRAIMTGDLSDAEIVTLIGRATALIMPSMYEGFGFPPLEAMAAGCPAIVSKSASLPEVCGEAALYFDARDSEQLCQAMLRVASDSTLRRSLIERGRAQARRFSWDSAAGKTLDVLASALGTVSSAASMPARA